VIKGLIFDLDGVIVNTDTYHYEAWKSVANKYSIQIDKSINHLQKTKDALLSADNNYRIANNKAQDVTIKKLTKSNPTMAKKFEENKGS